LKIRTFVLPICLVGMTQLAVAAEFTVKMLTNGPDKTTLVFDPMYLKAAVGDTVTFQPVDKLGHTSMSILTPGGANSWKATPNNAVKVTLDKEGVYLVACEVHKMMGMVAVLQAGKPVNLADAKKKAAEESAKMATNKDRFNKLLAMVK